MAEPIVEIEQGKLKGKKCDSHFLFKGIPYAKPPVGKLRFSAPVPPESWEGERDATKDCNICAQFDPEFGFAAGSEDCLYLNVCTPNLSPDDLLPVMFYIHGGGFVFGNGTDESVHGADYLVEKNVVVVTINYRLGVFGFLCLDRNEATGNMGLRDQVQALKWVQKNIAQFGGDPKNVTIFGISAGGASVEYLMLSPLTKGLFHKAIAHSGSTIAPWAQNDQLRELSRSLPVMKGNVVNDDDDVLKCLMEMSTNDLIDAYVMIMMKGKFHGGIGFYFTPTIEKAGAWETFLDKSPYDIIVQGEYTKIPFITGFCTREGLLLDCAAFNGSLTKLVNKEKQFIEYIAEFFGIDDSKLSEITEKFTNLYRQDNVSDEPDSFAIDFFTDVDFLGGIYTSASWIVKHNPSTYMFEFAYDGNLNYIKKKLNIQRKGACHGDDGGYLVKSALLDSATVTETDEIVRERVVQMWTNFAKYGVPTNVLNDVVTTNWEPIGTNMKYLVISDGLSMKEYPYPERTSLFKSLYDTFYSKK